MAQPVPFQVPPSSAFEQLRVRLEHAPEEHAAALLSAYDVLQELHDRGVLDAIKSGLAASDDLLETLVSSVDTPEAVRAFRNLLFWRSVLGRIEPEWFQGIFQSIPDGLAVVTAQRDEPVRFWTLLRRALSKDSLRSLMAGVDFLESFGRHLNSLEHAGRGRPPARRTG